MIKTKTLLPDGTLKITFQGDRIDPSFVNCLRRLMIGECPSYSLAGDFTIHLNTSSLNDEYIMTRVHMIPIFVSTIDDLSFFEKKPIFWIAAKGDIRNPLINNDDKDLMVTTHMLQVFDKSGNPLDVDIKQLIKYDFPILKLRKGQEFHLEVTPVSGIGHNHATFKTGMVTYKFENPVSSGEKDVKSVNPITKEKLETIADKKAYFKNDRGNPRNITITVRENGHYTVEDCVRLALRIMEDKLLRLQVLIDNRMGLGTDDTQTSIEIIPSTDIENYIQIKIVDPDVSDMPLATHSIGNLLANHMNYRIEELIKGDLEMIRDSMASDRRPHPLDEIIYLNIKTPKNLYGKDFTGNASERLLDETIGDLLGYIRQIKGKF